MPWNVISWKETCWYFRTIFMYTQSLIKFLRNWFHPREYSNYHKDFLLIVEINTICIGYEQHKLYCVCATQCMRINIFSLFKPYLHHQLHLSHTIWNLIRFYLGKIGWVNIYSGVSSAMRATWCTNTEPRYLFHLQYRSPCRHIITFNIHFPKNKFKINYRIIVLMAGSNTQSAHIHRPYKR